MKYTAAVLLLVPFLGGCGTYVARSDWRHENGGVTTFYPATMIDSQLVASPFASDDSEGLPHRAANSLLGVLDLPFSVTSDTICLPLDIWEHKPADSAKTDDTPRLQSQAAAQAN